MAYWLLKSEPSSYGINDLRRSRTTVWDGVRNFQARNHLLAARPGDQAFFYHSNGKPPGVAGLAEVIETDVVDPTQFDTSSHYFDPTSTPTEPRWRTIKIAFKETFPTFVSLDVLRTTFDVDDLLILRKGSRLSVTPVNDAVAVRLLEMAREKPPRRGTPRAIR